MRPRALKDGHYLVIRGLGEIIVEFAHGHERCGAEYADYVICFLLEAKDRIWRRYGYRDDDFPGQSMADHPYCDDRGGTGCDTVVYEDYSRTAEVSRRAGTAINRLAAVYLRDLRGDLLS